MATAPTSAPAPPGVKSGRLTVSLTTEMVFAAAAIGLSLASPTVSVTVAVAVSPWASTTTSGSRRVAATSRSSGVSVETSATPRPESPPEERTAGEREVTVSRGLEREQKKKEWKR